MHRTTIPLRLWGLVVAVTLSWSAATPAQEPMPKGAAPSGRAIIDKTGTVIIPAGRTRTFDPILPAAPNEITIEDESVLSYQVSPKDPKQLYLTGVKPGISRLTFRFPENPEITFVVMVQSDYEFLTRVIQVAVPTAKVNVIPGVSNEFVLTGYVTRPEDADIIMRIATASASGNQGNVINALQVGGVQQVQIDVVFASVNRTELRSRGFDFWFNGSSVQFNSIVGSLLGQQIQAGGAAQISGVSQDANLAFNIVPAPFLGALRALRTEGLVKFLAEPRVVTQSGREAFFRSGGQQAVLAPTAGITGPGAVLQPFGTELSVVPIVYGNNRIWMQVNPKLSRPNPALGIVVGGSLTPGFDEQQVSSAVMMESGQTFAIGGLMENIVDSDASRVPVLGDIPYLGTLFSRVNHQKKETEILILVTPRLVEPLDCSQVPRRMPGRETREPDDYELFLEGILEAPRGQRKPWSNGCYNAAYRCDPTYGTYPCIGNVCNGNGNVVNGINAAYGSPAVSPTPVVPAPTTMPSAPTPAAPAPMTLPEATQSQAAPVPVDEYNPTAPGRAVVGTAPRPLPTQGGGNDN